MKPYEQAFTLLLREMIDDKNTDFSIQMVNDILRGMKATSSHQITSSGEKKYGTIYIDEKEAVNYVTNIDFTRDTSGNFGIENIETSLAKKDVIIGHEFGHGKDALNFDPKNPSNMGVSTYMKGKAYISGFVQNIDLYYYKENAFDTKVNGKDYIAIPAVFKPEINSLYIENLGNKHFNQDKRITYFLKEQLINFNNANRIGDFFYFFESREEMNELFKSYGQKD